LVLWYKNNKGKHRSKTPLDIILEAVRAVRIHNLSIRQTALEFNINYNALIIIVKSSICDYWLWNNQPQVWD